MSVEGDGLLPPEQLLVIMTVDIGNGEFGEIQVRQGDSPRALGEAFVAANGLDPSAVIAEGATGPITLLHTLVEHIRMNKRAAYERVLAALPASDVEVSVGDERDTADSGSLGEAFEDTGTASVHSDRCGAVGEG